MKKKLLLALPILACASIASAGYVQPAPVILDLVARSATGSMSTARFSENPFEFIGCGVRNVLQPDGSVFRFGFCQAGVEENGTFTCFTEQPALVEKISEGSDYSFITFGWNEADECTRVGFSTQSFYIPEHQDKKK